MSLDAFAADQGEPVPSRPETVRRALADHLRAKGICHTARQRRRELMATINDGPPTTRARYPLNHLRQVLQEARHADDTELIHTALIDAVDGLIAHAERQARAVDELRSDLGHKQGIVTNIGGGTFRESLSPDNLREFASSSNGDRWFLGQDEATGIAHVVRPVEPSPKSS